MWIFWQSFPARHHLKASDMGGRRELFHLVSVPSLGQKPCILNHPSYLKPDQPSHLRFCPFYIRPDRVHHRVHVMHVASRACWSFSPRCQVLSRGQHCTPISHHQKVLPLDGDTAGSAGHKTAFVTCLVELQVVGWTLKKASFRYRQPVYRCSLATAGYRHTHTRGNSHVKKCGTYTDFRYGVSYIQATVKFKRQTQIQRIWATLPLDSNLPHICDNYNMFTVSLVAVKVWKANFNIQIIKNVVFHFSRLKICIASIMGFRPLNNCSETRSNDISCLVNERYSPW